MPTMPKVAEAEKRKKEEEEMKKKEEEEQKLKREKEEVCSFVDMIFYFI